MKLFTIQKEYKWLEFQKTGILRADDKIICEESFIESYFWIEDKMHKLLPKPDIKTIHPIWAWYRYCGKNKPDLRKSGHIEKGEIGYRIEFEINDDKVLLTDFSNWHLILNASEQDRINKKFIFCHLDEINQDYLESLLNDGFEIIENQIVLNWDNIILEKKSHVRDIQATLWHVNISQVINVDKFKSR